MGNSNEGNSGKNSEFCVNNLDTLKRKLEIIMRFTVRTSMFALFLTYSLNWWYFKQNNGEGGVTKVDCAAYSAGAGADKDGKPFSSLDAFYPYYLCEHTKPSTKLIHVVATFNALSLWGKSAYGPWKWSYIGLGLLQGYGLAWYSHFFIEQNKPATWQYPWYSFVSDQRLFIESLLGKHKLYA